MLESFIGTIFTCVIIVSLLLSVIQYIGIKADTKTYEPEVSYIGDYVQSIIIFLAISSLSLLLYVHIYFTKSNDSALYSSGLLFIILGALCGLFINFIYMFIMKIMSYFDKTNSTYFLKGYEKNWTWIFLMIAYSIYFLINKIGNYGFAYIALILSFLFWMNPTIESIKSKLTQLKSLSRSYWCCFVFVIICGIASVRYSKPPYTIAAIVGIILGFILGIMLMNIISKKMKPS